MLLNQASLRELVLEGRRRPWDLLRWVQPLAMVHVVFQHVPRTHAEASRFARPVGPSYRSHRLFASLVLVMEPGAGRRPQMQCQVFAKQPSR